MVFELYMMMENETTKIDKARTMRFIYTSLWCTLRRYALQYNVLSKQITIIGTIWLRQEGSWVILIHCMAIAYLYTR